MRNPFPLNPTLPPEERAIRLPSLDKSTRLEFAHRRVVELPLPKEEGRGEGKGNVGIGQACGHPDLLPKVEYAGALLNYAP